LAFDVFLRLGASAVNGVDQQVDKVVGNFLTRK
jgi:hypothetical protein